MYFQALWRKNVFHLMVFFYLINIVYSNSKLESLKRLQAKRDAVSSLPPIAGISLLGVGMDLHYDPFVAPRESMFNFTYNFGNSYQFFLNQSSLPDQNLDVSMMHYKVPDYVLVSTIGTETTYSNVFSNYQQVQNYNSNSWGFSLSIPFLLSLSVSNNDIQTFMSQDNLVMLRFIVATQFFQMSLPGTGLSLLSNNAIAMIAAASQYPFKDQPEPYMEFIERYGTHYMTSAIYGGSINCDSFFNNYSSQYTDNYQFNFGLSVGGMLAPFSFDLDISYSTYTKRNAYSTDSLTNLNVIGGLPATQNFAGLLGASNPQDIQDTKNFILAWRNSVPLNPVPVSYRLQPVSNLFVGTAQDSMYQAIVCYFDPVCYGKFLQVSVLDLLDYTVKKKSGG